MPHGISRRDFLRYSALALGMLGLTSILPKSAKPVLATTAAPLTVSPPGPQAMTLAGVLGTPIDVSVTKDGVYWLISDSGAPHSYDPVNQVWQPYGGAIDVAAQIPYLNTNSNAAISPGYFRADEIFQAGSTAAAPFAARWQGASGLPPTFQSNLAGAFQFGSGALLLQQGRYVYVDISGWANSPETLASLFGLWPDGSWKEGKFDFVITGRPLDATQAPATVGFVFGNEYLLGDPDQGGWSFLPMRPLSSFYQGAALDLLQQDGIQAVLVDGNVDDPSASLTVIKGPVVYTLENATSATPPQASYIAQRDPNWPENWHPILAQAPAGKVGDLWSINRAGVPLHYDGMIWTAVPLPNGLGATAVDAGVDGSVYATGDGNLYQLQSSGGWVLFATNQGEAWEGVSVVDSTRIWVRDGQGAVWSNVWGNTTAQFSQYTLGVPAQDIGANPDGTLWSCNDGTQIYRAVTEGAMSAEAIDSGPGVTSVRKVGSSSFGTGLFLATQNGQTALIRYSSPYIFKTDHLYFNGTSQRIAAGASSLFMYYYEFNGTDYASYVVAVDTETGAERWRQPHPVTSNGFGATPIYDPQHQLVYLFPNGNAVQALDAKTGIPAWSLALAQGLVTEPVLSGGLLIMTSYLPFANGESEVTLSAIDTLDAYQRATSGQAVVLRFQATGYVGATSQNAAIQPPMTPVVFGGSIYSATWLINYAGSSTLYLLQVDAGTGSVRNTYVKSGLFFGDPLPAVTPIAVSQLTMPSGQSAASLILVGPGGLIGTTLDDGDEALQYTSVNSVNPITTPLIYTGGAIYFGDNSGNIHGLDASFQPIANSPFQVTNGAAIAALAHVPVADDVVFAYVGQTDSLGFFSTSGTALLSLPTNQTASRYISEVIDGVVYVGGRRWADTSNTVGEVFAIRTSDLSALRDFVVESQLMQDYDTGATAVARYQTHVTVVDDQKVPQPMTSLKLWADAELTVIVAGQSSPIGPDAPLATQTDASGTLTILSDAADLFATPLRLWAPCMDPFERLVIFPDEAFHSRLPSMTADPTNDAPSTINLATGTAYGGTSPLLSQSQAQSAAQQIGAVTSAIGLGGGSTATPAVAGSSRRFKAYPDMVGYLHYSANVPATRTVTPQGSYGLSLDASNTFTAMTPADAAALIDQLEGDVLDEVGSQLGGFFSDLWHDIKSGIAKVEKAIVSVGNAISVGLTYVVNGVKHVFRQVVRDIEDVVSLVGAFFVKLIADIQDVIELLSLLLHFDKIIDTYKRLKPVLLGQFNSLETLIPQRIAPDVKAFVGAGEQAILDAFCTIKKAIDPSVTCGSALQTLRSVAASPAVSTLQGVGSTTATVFTVAPKGGGAASSHAVHCTWGLHKVKDHYKQATVSAGATTAGSGIAGALRAFIATLNSDTTLKTAFDNTARDFAATFNARSTSQFLQMALVDLLDILQDLLIGSLALTDALLQGLLAQAADLVNFFVGASDGILTRSLDIPILSDLFELIVEDDLTFFNLIVLVAAIPVTILYRVIEGVWPGDQLPQGASGTQPGLLGLTALGRSFGLLDVACYIGNTFFAPAADYFILEDETPPILTIVLLTLGLCTTATSVYGISNQAEGANLGMQLGQLLVNSVSEIPDASVEADFKPLGPMLLMCFGLGAIGTYIYGVANESMDGASFAANLMSEIPSVVRPIVYLAKEYPVATTLLVSTFDLLANMVTAATEGVGVQINWDTLAPPTALPPVAEPNLKPAQRTFLPFVQTTP